MSFYDRSIYIYSFLILFSIFSFASGANYLETELIFGLPNGNLLVVIGLLACALLGRELSWTYHKMKRLNTLSILLALLWYPTGILLSGNKELNFVYDATDSAVFDVITIGIVGWCLLFMLLSAGMRLKAILKRKFFPSSPRSNS
jgi:hypothetical protein